MKRILIVDDKAENAYYLQALLTGHGYAVDSACHGAEALVVARQSPPDVIISDLLMPVMDGYTLLRLWKADARLKQIPFIVYTATYTEPEDEQLALSLGADAFILKPAEPEDFLIRLRQVQANVTAPVPASPKHPSGEEKELLKVYSTALIRKLEEKTLQLEESNRALQRDLAERKKLEAELALREQRLNAFFTSAPAGLVLLDKELRYLQLNETVAKVNGVPMAEHLGKTIREVLPKLAPVAEPLLQQVLATGEPMLNIELSGETPGQPGVLRHWMESFFPILGKDGCPEGVGVIFVEITERKQAEENLRLLNSAVMQTQESVLITDAQLDEPGPKIIFVNPAFTRMTGYAAAEVIGKTPRILQGPKTDAALLQRLRQNLERGEDFAGEVMQYRKDGTEYMQEWQIAPLRDAAGKITHFVSIQQDITGRKQSEKVVRESEEKFSKIFQASPMAMALSTVGEGRYLDANQEFLKMLQRPREEVIGHTAEELGVWLRPGQRADYLARIKEHGAIRNVELEIRGRTGQITHILWSVEVVVIGGENCLLGSSLDITERKRAETALVESNEKFNQLADNINDVFWIRSPDLREVYYVSPAFEKIWGRSLASLYASPHKWADFILPEDRGRVLAAFAALTGDQPGLDIEYRILRPDGDLRWVRVRGVQVRDPAGKVIRHIGIVTDITKAKGAEEEIRWKSALLEAQIDASLDGILVVDNHGRKIIQNQRMNDLWKIPPQIVADKDDTTQVQFVTSRTKNPREFADKVAWLYAHPDEISRDEIHAVDGTILDRYSSPVRDKTGKYYGRIWTFRDITDQRKLEAQFRQSQKMEAFGQLAGGVAHDFNNILAVIQLQAGMLKSDQSLSLEQIDFVQDIENAALRASNLTRQLLLFSRQQAMQPRDLNLKDVVANFSKMLQRTLGEQIQLQFKFSEQPLLIHADPGMIDQILLNLTVNARDAMPKGGRILIETAVVDLDEATAAQSPQARPGAYACLIVSDTGCGIPPEILPRIFEPFFTTKEVGKGTGLGLATIFGVVEQHKGWINVYSEVDRGTTFRVYLPRLTVVPENKALWPSFSPIRGGTETILLVEDEASLRVSVLTALSRFGYRVLEATQGDEAWELWQQHRAEIRLLLTDLVMPGSFTGKELAEKILQQDPKLKVIYTSGYSAEIAGKDFKLEEGVNFLSKPFEARQLAQTIRNRLDEP